MGNLFRAFFFKLRKDITFRVTLIVGAAVAVLMMLIFLMIDYAIDIGVKTCTGQTLFLVSFTPTSNFGLAIPVNLITFTVLEFSNGVIRNKIVVGNSKFKIYLGLFLSGLVFALLLLLTYAGLCTLLGTICGGFDPNGVAMGSIGAGEGSAGYATPQFIGYTLLIAILVYVSITAFTVFVSTLLRNVGPSIPLTLLPLILLAIIGPIVYQFVPEARDALIFLNPLQVLGNPTADSTGHMYFTNKQLIGTVVCNLMYTGIFFGFGTLIFIKRDVK